MIKKLKRKAESNVSLTFSYSYYKQAPDTQSLMAWVNSLRESNPEKDVSLILNHHFY